MILKAVVLIISTKNRRTRKGNKLRVYLPYFVLNFSSKSFHVVVEISDAPFFNQVTHELLFIMFFFYCVLISYSEIRRICGRSEWFQGRRFAWKSDVILTAKSRDNTESSRVKSPLALQLACIRWCTRSPCDYKLIAHLYNSRITPWFESKMPDNTFSFFYLFVQLKTRDF